MGLTPASRRWRTPKALSNSPGRLSAEIVRNGGRANEQHNVAADNRDVVAKIEQYLKTARTESARWPVT